MRDLKKRLLEIAPSINFDKKAIKSLFIENKDKFDNVIFEKCEHIWLFTNKAFNRCQFTDCSFAGFARCVFQDCLFIRGNFSAAEIRHCLFGRSAFWACKLSNCLLKDSDFETAKLEFCRIKSCILFNIGGLRGKDYHLNNCDTKTFCVKTKWDLIHYTYTAPTQSLPTLVIVYSPTEGYIPTHKILTFWSQFNVRMVLVHPSIEFNHPIFQNKENINGIFIPGGPLNMKNDDLHSRFELALLMMAEEYNIPCLGICHGHQMLGRYFGAKFHYLPDHELSENIIVNKQSEFLYPIMIQNKHLESIRTTKEGDFYYEGECLHHYAASFTEIPVNVTVSATSQDGDIEAFEAGNNKNLISVQHHPESFLHQVFHRPKSMKKNTL